MLGDSKALENGCKWLSKAYRERQLPAQVRYSVQAHFGFHAICHQAQTEVGIKGTGTQCIFFKNLSQASTYLASGVVTLEP